MTLSEALRPEPGEILAAIGCGGKTTILRQLARENAERGVLIAPSTRISLTEVEPWPNVRYLGEARSGKLIAADIGTICAAAAGAHLTLIEADGSKRMPLKGWAPYEPVVPAFATRTLGVISARACGLRACEENVHRLPLFLTQTGVQEGAVVDEAAIARMIARQMGVSAVGRRAILINQADDAALRRIAARIADHCADFDGELFIGSAWEATSWTRA